MREGRPSGPDYRRTILLAALVIGMCIIAAVCIWGYFSNLGHVFAELDKP